MTVAAAIRRIVRQRAHERCEYCLLPESAGEIAWHVEHIRARQHGGGDDLDNLALACDKCNYRKGPNLAGIDPQTDVTTELFHPRRHDWRDHFTLQGAAIAGLTPTGRATVALLQMNRTKMMQLRQILLKSGAF